jgi:hypothetical protein
MSEDVIAISIDTYTGKAHPGTFHYEMRSNTGRYVKGWMPKSEAAKLKIGWRVDHGFAA